MKERLAKTVDIARRAGEVALRHYGQVSGERKGDQSLVTVADREVERLVRGDLARHFPGEVVLGEEFGRGGPADSDWVWFIDPIDGTTNYVHGIPCWCVGIGLMRAGEPVLGVIYQPLLREVCAGAVGLGAWRNDTPCRPWLGRAPLTSTDPVLLPEEVLADGFQLRGEGKLRAMGSALVHFAMVAYGAARAAIWHAGDCGWDLVAGIAICRAAGALVCRYDGSQPDLSVLTTGQPQPYPLCAAAPETMELLVERLAAAGIRE